MDSRRKIIILATSGVAIALLAGIGGGWLVRGREVGTLKERVSDLESRADAPASTEATATAETTSPAELPQKPADVSPPADAAPPAERETGVSEHQPGWVSSVSNANGTWTLRIDYVQFLSGGEAADAAAAHGDESPPPNDYYIVNDNPKVREFPIQAGISVLTVINNDGSCDPAGHMMPLAEWGAAMNGPLSELFKSNLYWVTVTDGTITAIQAQYVP